MTNQGSGRLTTHVLDTARGKPAANMQIDLYRVEGEEMAKLASVRTNSDGRTDSPLLEGEDFRRGIYELRFHAGAYHGRTADEVAFLNIVPIRFGIDDAQAHYHVPLLVSPFGYSTYRGS